MVYLVWQQKAGLIQCIKYNIFSVLIALINGFYGDWVIFM